MKSSRSAFLWNILGSIATAASSLLLLMFAGRAQGEASAGIFSISLAISTLFETIGLYEVRTYQSSDLKEKYKFDEYFTLRIFTCILMMLACLGYIVWKGYSSLELQSIILMCIYKCLDAFADVTHGLFQQKNKLEIAGKSLFFRTTLGTLTYMIAVYYYDNLVFPLLFMNIVTIIWIILYDLPHTLKMCKKWISINYEKILSLMIECLPLCICSFISIYLINSPKYAIDSYASNEMQGIFGYIFMPTSVINLFSIFILRPLIGDLSESWNNRYKEKFIKLVFIIVGWICLLTGITLLGGYFLGIPILSILYSTDLSNYRYELMIILLGGGFSALTTAFYYILTVMRQQRYVIITYGIVFPISLWLVPFLTKQFSLIGASYGYLLAMIFLDLGLCITFIITMKKSNHYKKMEE